jgi:hypothetical protein
MNSAIADFTANGIHGLISQPRRREVIWIC